MSVALPSNTSFKIQTAVGPPAAFADVPGCISFDFGNIAADVIDSTDFDSADDMEESEAGIKRSSNGSFAFNWEPGNTIQEDIRASIGETKVFEATDEGQTDTCTAVILGVSNPRQVGTKRVITVTIKLSGPIVTDEA